MTPVSFVDDPAIDRQLGDDLALEIREAVQPGGDCAGCSQPLGNGPLRLDVQGGAHARLVYPRHAACTPTPDVDGLSFIRPEHTFSVNAFRGDLVRQPPRKWWSFTRPPVEEHPMAVIVINPSVDGFFLPLDMTSLLDTYLDRGFSAPPNLPIGDVETAARSQLDLHINGTTITIRDRLLGNTYEVRNKNGKLARLIQEGQQAIVAMTYQHWASRISGLQGVDRIMTDTTHTAAVWLPYTNGSTE